MARAKRPAPKSRGVRRAWMGVGLFWMVFRGAYLAADVVHHRLGWWSAVDAAIVLFGAALLVAGLLSPVAAD